MLLAEGGQVLLRERQRRVGIAAADDFYQALLLQMECQLRAFLQYLRRRRHQQSLEAAQSMRALLEHFSAAALTMTQAMRRPGLCGSQALQGLQ